MDQNRRSYLPIGSLLEFLNWLPGHTHAASVLPGAALQGLCGLQLQEALRLTWDHVDLEAGTITIEKTDEGTPTPQG
jgi:integrase